MYIYREGFNSGFFNSGVLVFILEKMQLARAHFVTNSDGPKAQSDKIVTEPKSTKYWRSPKIKILAEPKTQNTDEPNSTKY